MSNVFEQTLQKEVRDLQQVGYPHSNAAAAVSAAKTARMVLEFRGLMEVLPQGQQNFFYPKIKLLFEAVMLTGMHALMDNKLEGMSPQEAHEECERVEEVLEKIYYNLDAALTQEVLRVAEVEAPLQ